LAHLLGRNPAGVVVGCSSVDWFDIRGASNGAWSRAT